MYVYAGIDEAGYGPMFGPLMVARSVFVIPRLDPHQTPDPPHLWQRLSKAVCRGLQGRNGRIPVADSKQLKSQAVGIKHLEVGCLAFAGLAGVRPNNLCDWLDALGETAHHRLDGLPWYAPCDARPWGALPAANTPGEIAVARGMLAATAHRIGVGVADMGAFAVFEDTFNRMVSATRSKAATSFTFVAKHLVHIWQTFGHHSPVVVVDRQGGRTAYREPLQLAFPDAHIQILCETPETSTYLLTSPALPGVPTSAGMSEPSRSMRITFQVEAESSHMPVALASMIAKYTRELLMARFNAYFTHHVPDLRPTAGYATDARRFWQELSPKLNDLAIPADVLCRVC